MSTTMRHSSEPTRPALPSFHLVLVFGLLISAWLVGQGLAHAQDDSETSTQPAFSVSSQRIHEPGAAEPPQVQVHFQRLDHLDFRVYRVKDARAFFAGLREAHTLGSPEYDVEQEPTPIERLAAWKARCRAAVTDFFRQQVTWQYRLARRNEAARETIVQRRTVRFTQFAQVPLLNPDQVVATWRELLPDTRSTDSRTIPLDLKDPGVYVVEAVHGHLRASTVVVSSRLGLIAKTAPGQVLLFAVDRRSGLPKADCGASVIVDQQVLAEGRTGADGVFVAEVARREADDMIAMASCGDDTVVTDPGAYFLRETARALKGYVYTDRPVYRPGHTVNVKAVLRWIDRGGLPRPFDRQQVEMVVTDPDQKVVLRQQRPVDRFGSAFTSLTLPATAALGDYVVSINSEDSEATGGFEVQEYRKPEFEVSVSAPQRYYLKGTTAKVKVSARYYFGQPVANGHVTLVTYSSGYWSPWRYLREDGDEDREDAGYYGNQEDEIEADLDASGEATIDVDVGGDTGSDVSLRLEARVTDATGREVSGRTTIVGTVGPYVVAIEPNRYVQAAGAAAQFRIRVTDYEGRPQAKQPVALALGQLEQRYGPSNGPLKVAASATVTTGADGFATWQATVPPEPGPYQVRAEARAGGRVMLGRGNIWVPGGDSRAFDTEDRSVELIPDKTTYAPGEIARFLLRGSAKPNAILITKEHASASWHEVRRVGTGETFEVPITDQDIGDVWVNVVFVLDDNTSTAERRLKVPAVQRQLQVSVTAAQAVARPRDPGVLTVRTLDASGAPVAAQVSLGVVDEALYGVQPDRTPDPVTFFYKRHYSSVYTSYSRTYAFTGYSGTQLLQLARQRRRPMSLADFKADRPERPPVRKQFPDAIYWTADLTTDATGTATVKIAYPDSLTTWRVTARAVTEDTKLGATLSRTATTKDVIVRVAAPRFLTEGDTVRVPVIAHNYLPEAGAFGIGLTATGVTAIGGGQGASLRVQIPSRGEHRSGWEFKAGTPGTATFTGSASGGADSDAMEVSLPVLPFGLVTEQGASGTLVETAERAVTLDVPEASNPGARTVEVTLAPSMAGSMLGAVDYLTGYPYGCTEQTLSSFLPNLLVMRALGQLGIAPTERTALAGRFANAGLQRLQDYQHEDGGFGWWKTDDTHPFMTAYAVYGYLEAKGAGLAIDNDRVRSGLASIVEQYRAYPRMVPDLKAYLAFVVAKAASQSVTPEADEGKAWDAAAARDELWNARGRMGAHGRALLLMTLDLARDTRANALAAEITGAVNTRGDLSWWAAENDPLLEDYADTSVEATALAVQALAPRDPGNPVLERAVRWLLANRGSGAYWYTTKQTALALYGLLAYMKARNEGPSAFTVDVFVNGQKAGSHAFSPESLTSPDPVRVAATARAGSNDVRIVKRGGGTLYWTATARYYDTREAAERKGSRTLALSRRYFALTPVQTTGRDVRTVHREVPFTGTAKPGDLILVRITVAGAADWRYLVIEDPIPAGTEAVSNQDAYELEKPGPWWQFGRGRREYRDARVVQFQDRLPDGRTDFSYLLKVVTPGQFRAMPAQVRPMYVPGVSASSSGERMTVVDPAAPQAPSGGGVQ
jgi:hypothetical protein